MNRIALLLALLLLPALAHADPKTEFVTATPTVDTNQYAAGELIGGLLTFSTAFPTTNNKGYVISVRIIDQSKQSSDLDLVLFSANPTATTFTDQQALDIADADLAKVVAVINFASAQRFAFSDNGVVYLGSLAIPVQGLSSNAPVRTLYGALVSRGTPTYAAATDVSVTLGISQD